MGSKERVALCAMVLCGIASSSLGLTLRKVGETESPRVGAYQKNFKGVTTGVISEDRNSIIDFPFLDVHDNFYYGKSIQLNCNASFPVQWVYRGDGSPSVHGETYRYAPDFYVPETYLHQASVVFSHSHAKQTGNYSCEGINKPEILSWFYIFVPDNTTFLLDTGKTHEISVNPKAKDLSIILPCTPSNATAKVQLFRRLSQDMLKPITQRGFTSYDPTRGFRLSYKNYKYVLGNYTCTLTNERGMERLNFAVDIVQEADQTQVGEGAGPSLKISYDNANDRIMCCNEGSNETPIMRSTACESVPDCRIKIPYLSKKTCPRGSCETHVMTVNKTCVAYELSESRDAGIVECSKGKEKILQQFSKEEDVILTEFDSMPDTGDILSIMKEPHPKDESIDRYICHSNSFFFATGLKMAWENGDGSLAFIQENSFPLSNNFQVDDDHNHTTLYCFAPVWNSPTEWRNVTFQLIRRDLRESFRDEDVPVEKLLTPEEVAATLAIRNMTILAICVIVIIFVTIIASFCYSLCFSTWMESIKRKRRERKRKSVRFKIETDSEDSSSLESVVSDG